MFSYDCCFSFQTLEHKNLNSALLDLILGPSSPAVCSHSGWPTAQIRPPCSQRMAFRGSPAAIKAKRHQSPWLTWIGLILFLKPAKLEATTHLVVAKLMSWCNKCISICFNHPECSFSKTYWWGLHLFSLRLLTTIANGEREIKALTRCSCIPLSPGPLFVKYVFIFKRKRELFPSLLSLSSIFNLKRSGDFLSYTFLHKPYFSWNIMHVC